MVRRSGYTAHCSILCNGLNEDFMARVTVEDCLDNVDNRFQLVLIATRRARQLAKGLVDAWILDQVPLDEPVHGEMTEAERAELEAEVGERAAVPVVAVRENTGDEYSPLGSPALNSPAPGHLLPVS